MQETDQELEWLSKTNAFKYNI